MQYTNVFVVLFFVGAFLDAAIHLSLGFIDYSFRKKHGMEIPPEVGASVDKETLSRTCAYEDAKHFFSVPEILVSLALKVYLAASGFYPAVFETVFTWTGSAFLVNVLFLLFISVPDAIVGIPFSLYRVFGIEKKFGFCKQTFGMWIVDAVKEAVVSAVLALPLVAVAGFLFRVAPSSWWIFLAAAYIAFSLAVSVIYPVFIAPLFNKFTPLEDGELKSRLDSLLARCHFRSGGLFVMDASRRSGHSNAYFTGFGRTKRVVLYDTLIEQLTPAEIEAVLGHELGHFKKHHIIRRMLVVIPVVFAALFVVSLALRYPPLYEGFGFSVMKEAGGEVSHRMMMAGLVLFGIVFSGFSPLAGVVLNFFSRRDEFQADAFSAEVCGGCEELVSALVKLNKENLSEMQVPKIYSVFHYNHPPLLERIRALREKKR